MSDRNILFLTWYPVTPSEELLSLQTLHRQKCLCWVHFDKQLLSCYSILIAWLQMLQNICHSQVSLLWKELVFIKPFVQCPLRLIVSHACGPPNTHGSDYNVYQHPLTQFRTRKLLWSGTDKIPSTIQFYGPPDHYNTFSKWSKETVCTTGFEMWTIE